MSDTRSGQSTVVAGRYRLGARLGEGGLSTAFEAYDEVRETRVCLKVLREVSRAGLDSLRQEFQFVVRLAHPNLVRVLDFGVLPGREPKRRPFLVAELVRGQTLGAFAATGETSRVADALAGVLAALAFLHQNRIVHGDLKPDNILVDPSGHPTLLDLSCASTIGSVSALLSGTPDFLAPERWKLEPSDPRSDLYALGKTIAALGEHAPTAWRALVDELSQPMIGDRPSGAGELLERLRLPPLSGGIFQRTPALMEREEVLEVFDHDLRELVHGRSTGHVLSLVGEHGVGVTRALDECHFRAGEQVESLRLPISSSVSCERLLRQFLSIDGSLSGAELALELEVALARRSEPLVLVQDDCDRLEPKGRALIEALARSLGPNSKTLLVLGSHTDLTLPGRTVTLKPLSRSSVIRWFTEAGYASEAAVAAARVPGYPSTLVNATSELARGVAAARVSADDRLYIPEQARDATGQSAVVWGLLAAAPNSLPTALIRACGSDGERVLRSSDVVVRGELAGLAPNVARGALLSTLSPTARASALGALIQFANQLPPEEGLPLEVQGHLRLGELETACERWLAAFDPGRPAVWSSIANQLVERLARSLSPVSLKVGTPLARVFLATGEPERALAVLESSGGAGDRSVWARALLESGRPVEAIERLSGGPRDAEEAAIAAKAALRLSDHHRAVRFATFGLAAAPDPERTADLEECVGAAALYLGDLEEADLHFQRALSSGAGSPMSKYRAHSYRGMVAFRKGDIQAASAAYREALSVVEGEGLGDQIARASLNLGTALHGLGRLGAALRSYERGERLARALGQRDLRLTLQFNLGKLYDDLGAYAMAEAKLQEALEQAKADGSRFFECAALAGLAEIAIDRGEPREVAALLDEAARGFEETGSIREGLEVKLTQVRGCLALRARAEARALCQTLSGLPHLAPMADVRLAVALEHARAIDDPKESLRLVAALCEDASLRAFPELAARVFSFRAELEGELGLGDASARWVEAHAIWSSMAEGLEPAFAEGFWRRSDRAKSVALSRREPPNARPHETDRVSKLERLLTSFRKLNSSLDIDDVLALAIDEAIELTGAERGFLILVDAEKKLEVRTARHVERSAVLGEREAFSRGVASRAIETREPVISIDAPTDPRFSGQHSVHAMSLRSVIAVPIRSPDGVLGAIYLDNQYRPSRFGQGDTDLLLAFADQVALALRNARWALAYRARAEELLLARDQIQQFVDQQKQEISSLKEAVRLQQSELQHRFDSSSMVGKSPALRRVFSLIDRVIDTNLSVLVTGESGTGKELVARAIHFGSQRRAAPFVGINCAALPETLLESELFGHVRGAFTGADKDRQGLVVSARGGTLFLDELGEMPLSLQAKLLRVLQEKEVRPIGALVASPVDFRLVTATNRSLRDEVEKGRFREDLYYRVGVVEVSLPPLRDRKEDLPDLIVHFVDKASRALGRPAPRVSAGALAALEAHAFPGNIRELENLITKAVVLSDGSLIGPQDLGLGPSSSNGPTSKKSGLIETKARYLAALEAAGWNAKKACEALGVPRATFYRKLDALGIKRPERS